MPVCYSHVFACKLKGIAQPHEIELCPHDLSANARLLIDCIHTH